MASREAHCSSCDDDNETYTCGGCSKIFSFAHLSQHREKNHQKSDQINENFNSFQQILNDQKNNLNQNILIQKINQWEKDSIEKIQQTADACRQQIIEYTNQYIMEIENDLNDIFEEPIKARKGNKFNENDLDQLEEKFSELKEDFNKRSYVSVEKQESSAFINEIYVFIPIDREPNWEQNATTIAGGNGQGYDLEHLDHPYGICIDDDQTIYIADCDNHRIVEWKSNAIFGRIVKRENDEVDEMYKMYERDEMDELLYPTDVIIDKKNNSLIISDWGNRRIIEWSLENIADNGQVIISDIDCWGLAVDRNGYIYVCDHEKHEVTRWERDETEGTVVAGGNGKGNQLNQFNSPRYIFVDDDLSLYVSDNNNHRVMKWEKDAKEGVVVAGGDGEGDSLRQLSYPLGVIVDQIGQIYVADFGNHRVMRWFEGDKQGTVVAGGNEVGDESDQLNSPISLSFDKQGNLYVSDWENHRIQKFEVIYVENMFHMLDEIKQSKMDE